MQLSPQFYISVNLSTPMCRYITLVNQLKRFKTQLFFSAVKFVAYSYETGIAKSLGGLAEGPIVGPCSSLFLIGLAFV